MQNLFKSNNTFFITKMLDNGYFSFTYNRNEIRISDKDFSKPKWTVYNFSCNKIITVNSQIYLQNFRMSCQLHIACNYFFCF